MQSAVCSVSVQCNRHLKVEVEVQVLRAACSAVLSRAACCMLRAMT
jgi:hypothetical protein